MSSGNDSILEMYLFETNTLLEQLDSIALAAEQENMFSENDVNELFRIMHTIKGSSAMMEFNSMMTVAHRIEDMFFIIRDQGMDVVPEADRPELYDLTFQAIDFFRGEVEKMENGQALSDDIDSFVAKINTLIAKLKGETPPEAPASAEGASGEGAISIATNEEFGYSILVFFDEGSGMESLRAHMLVMEVRDFCGEADFIFTPADVETNPESSEIIVENGFLLQFRTAEDRDSAIHAVTGAGSVRDYQTADPAAPKVPEVVVAEPVAEKAPEPVAQPAAAPAPAAPKAAAKAAPAPAAAPGKESLISVNLSKLDQLVAVVGEIVISESMVTGNPDLDGLRLDSFTKSARQLRKLTDELQDVAMSLRMVPVSGIFQKMNRIVRDMGKKLGKRVKLTLIGENTEVDKTIVDSISDPIMHIVRNSMDHGIEEHESERTALGKDPVGELILSARHTGSDVIIEIIDDGQGVNCDKVLAKAIRQGLASPDVEYTNKEILNFLLMPGFSTNTEVTEFSGRGVGMDVAKKNVEDVGGTVTITSELGHGMTTTLKIPLTMAIMDGMEVSVGGSIFTIPINNIRQSFKVSNSDIIQDAARGEMTKIMDNYYPVLRVKEVYGLEKGADDISDGILLWVESNEATYCLFVDELIGEHQVVVKPLPAYVNAFNVKGKGITGCTILNDGSIGIILDVSNIYTSAR